MQRVDDSERPFLRRDIEGNYEFILPRHGYYKRGRVIPC
jgi:hypothetical protein